MKEFQEILELMNLQFDNLQKRFNYGFDKMRTEYIQKTAKLLKIPVWYIGNKRVDVGEYETAKGMFLNNHPLQCRCTQFIMEDLCV